MSIRSERVSPTVKAKELIIGETMVLIEDLKKDFDARASWGSTVQAKYDQKVIKQMKKVVNRLARDIGADDQYLDVV